MFKTLKNAWKTPELQKKMFFTLIIVLIYRLGASIYVPYVNGNFSAMFQTQYGTSIFGMMNMMSGSAMQYATLFALSVSPYITASIVMQLLTIAIPALERLSKDGANGQKKINAITRYLTVGLAFLTGLGYALILRRGLVEDGVQKMKYLVREDWYAVFVITACFCAGAAIVMWMAELINEKGIGNGISVILCVNIIAGLRTPVVQIWQGFGEGETWISGTLVALLVVALAIASVGFIVFVTNSERRIPIQYAKRVVGRKMYGGQATNLPIKLNMSGVMPVIFAVSIASIPATIAEFITNEENKFKIFVASFLGADTWLYLVISLVLIVAFSYFYVMISFNPVEVANNISSNGGAIPGHRPGRPTVQYINRILKRITLMGAFFLCIVAGLPMLITVIVRALQNAGAWYPYGMQALAFSGTSMLIIVGVILEMIRDLEAQLSLRANKGFLN